MDRIESSFHSGCFGCHERRQIDSPFFSLATHSDYLWLRSVLLTNATVATVGLGLTIPLAFGSDVVMGKPNVLTFSSLMGATTVLVGFILVNAGNGENDTTETNMDDNSPMELSTRLSTEEIDFNPADGDENRAIDSFIG
eukprot:scaffold756_cov158-Amphora_coffeaeformis.AAC.9